MAERLEEFDFKRGPSTKNYPWDKWADGAAWKVWRGREYDTSDNAFRVACGRHARKIGKRLQTRVVRDGIVIRFFDSED